MRLGLIADVHANAVALEAVLAALDDAKVDRIVCAGDVVGYGPHPGECVRLVRESADVCVAGNHDRMVDTPKRYAHHPTAGPGLRHAAATLDRAARTWLRELPAQTTIEDGSVIVSHAHPAVDGGWQYVYPNEFATVAATVSADFLVLGHTHVQAAETANGTTVVNPGSVGQPRDGDSRAAFAILDTEASTVELERVPYDIGRVVEQIREVGLPTETATRLREAR